jgi:hypothetical protein
MSRPVQTSSVRSALFSQKNRQALQQMLVDDFQPRIGRLDERQMDRLERTLDHYVEAVYEAQGDKPLPILNREVLGITRQDFSKYLQRQDAVRQAPQAPVQTVMNEQLFHDTGKRFELLQQDRQEVKALMPAVPNFRIPLDDEGPSSLDLFEQAKKKREEEARRVAGSMQDAGERMDPSLVKRLTADDTFRQGQMTFNKATDMLLQERQKAPRTMDMPLVVPPDGRELALANMISPSRFLMPDEPSTANPVVLMPNPGPRLGQGDANSNQTLTVPPFLSPQKTNLPQDYLIRQDPVVTYKEIENNLFLYSADRNWLQNTKENRYSFTVMFDPAANGNKLSSQIYSQEKFKNITRIELVKAILPLEGLDVLIQRTATDLSDTRYQTNVLSLPYTTVRIPELENNNYGTDNFVDRAFGVLQYDANWYSDPGTTPTQTDSRGYTALIPKFLKCQKVYAPTPLSTLQKLTIDLLRPNGANLSLLADTFDISNISVITSAITSTNRYAGNVSATPAYFFIKSENYFNRFQIATGDTIRIGNFGYTNPTFTSAESVTAQDFVTWINRPEGHLVVGIAYDSGSSSVVGSNAVGYANYIIIEGKYDEAELLKGNITPYRFGGPSGDIGALLSDSASEVNSTRRLMNLSRQTQFVFRVITRELDGTATLRPDNM